MSYTFAQTGWGWCQFDRTYYQVVVRFGDVIKCQQRGRAINPKKSCDVPKGGLQSWALCSWECSRRTPF